MFEEGPQTVVFKFGPILLASILLATVRREFVGQLVRDKIITLFLLIADQALICSIGKEVYETCNKRTRCNEWT